MTYAKRWFWLIAGVTTLIAGAACSNALGTDSAAPDAERGPTNGSTSSSGGGANDGTTPGASAAAPPGAPTATGVVLLHAGAFGAFRLCFENSPKAIPQPDSTVMPEANVVGVEVGSLVRIDPITSAPGKVYVIDERTVRTTGATPCDELVGVVKTQRTLRKNIDFFEANVLPDPLGVTHVTVLGLTGCAGSLLLQDMGIDPATCPAPYGPTEQTSGNLQLKPIDLTTTIAGATDTNLPVQLFQMSTNVDTFKKTGTLSVTFGDLAGGAGPLAQPVPTSPIFTGGAQASLTLDQKTDAVYGSTGFRVTVDSPDGTASVDQSLASVQELSSSTDLPTTYYRVASNYALLLVGDPTHKALLANGDANPDYNPRRALHLLAVPVLDPSKIDAGVEAGTSSSSGSSGSPDGGL